MSLNNHIRRWVDEVASLCRPDEVVVCDGSQAEKERLTAEAVKAGDLLPLNQERLPGCYLHRSHPNDVARTEHTTFVCTREKDEVGPTNNWMAPDDAYGRLSGIFQGSMQGRKMYVVPFLMGPSGSPFSKVGVEITDSIYVVLNMQIMTRMGRVALDHLGDSGDFTRCLHSTADLNPERRYISHFPQDNTIWSVGSGYGGNALLGKKCLGLRIASALGRKEGWLAEHMLIIGVESPDGRVRYVCGAFPSACGKTNLAMLVPPASHKGYRVWTVGDDIAWIRPGPDGRLWAVNPEAGFFGVAPGTSAKTNPNAIATISRNAIFTNVALKSDGTVWWEGADGSPPAKCIDWRSREWTPDSADKAAHPNARFTAPATQCPSISPEWEKPEGVPISAIVFGCRRSSVVPLVYESFDWQHGVYLGATLSSETTAAAAGATGVVRRDPMAMLPFCGYNMADYFRHWLEMGKRTKNPPRIYRANWFRIDENGKFLWPGFGENIRVLKWIIERCSDESKAVETPIGYLPSPKRFDADGLPLPKAHLGSLFAIDKDGWSNTIKSQADFFTKFGDRMPKELIEERKAFAKRIRTLK